MAEPDSIIIPLLREMRAETSAGFAVIDARFAAVEMRLNKVNESLVTFRHALNADSLPSKYDRRI